MVETLTEIELETSNNDQNIQNQIVRKYKQTIDIAETLFILQKTNAMELKEWVLENRRGQDLFRIITSNLSLDHPASDSLARVMLLTPVEQDVFYEVYKSVHMQLRGNFKTLKRRKDTGTVLLSLI